MINNNNAIANTLLDNGANINLQSASGDTPLMMIALTRNIGLLNIFYTRNDIAPMASIQNSNGDTALHIAIRWALLSALPDDDSIVSMPMVLQDRWVNFVNKFINFLAGTPHPQIPNESLENLYAIQNNEQLTAPRIVRNWEQDNIHPQQQIVIRTGINFNPRGNLAPGTLDDQQMRNYQLPYSDGIDNLVSM